MRKQFIEGLIERAQTDERILLLTADLGFGAVEPFAEKFPNRYLNVGVAEQGMMAVATGLAQQGFHPYCYSIATFAIARTWEFLRNGPVAHGLTMGVIGIGPGFDYGVDGHTHHALEDVGLVRLLPDARVLCPADAVSARHFAAQELAPNVLTYFRLARSNDHCAVPRLTSDLCVDAHEKIIILALGDAWLQAIGIFNELASTGLVVEVAVIEELGTNASERSLRLLSQFAAVIVVESHLDRGGLGSAVASELGSVGWGGRLLCVGAKGLAVGPLGSSDYLWRRYSLELSEIRDWCDWALARK